MKWKNKKSVRECEGCDHCVALGEGDFACIENDEPVIVIESYERTKEYCYCINL